MNANRKDRCEEGKKAYRATCRDTINGQLIARTTFLADNDNGARERGWQLMARHGTDIMVRVERVKNATANERTYAGQECVIRTAATLSDGRVIFALKTLAGTVCTSGSQARLHEIVADRMMKLVKSL